MLRCALIGFRKQPSAVSRRRSRRSRWRWSRSKWKPCERPPQGIVIQAHKSSAQLRFLQLLSPQSAALAHSRSSSKQTSGAHGCVKLSCLCHHLLHLVWLHLNVWTVHIKREREGLFHHQICHHNLCQDFFFSVQLYFQNESKLCLNALELDELFRLNRLGRETLFVGLEPHFKPTESIAVVSLEMYLH